jgi:hypothetical protein
MRIAIILVVAALLLAGCNPNQERESACKVARLVAAHGADAKLTDLLVTLANCEKARSVSVHDRCKASSTQIFVFSSLTPSRNIRRLVSRGLTC